MEKLIIFKIVFSNYNLCELCFHMRGLDTSL